MIPGLTLVIMTALVFILEVSHFVPTPLRTIVSRLFRNHLIQVQYICFRDIFSILKFAPELYSLYTKPLTSVRRAMNITFAVTYGNYYYF